MTEESSADVIIQIAKPVLEQKKLYLITKRAFDIVCSFLGLLILAIPTQKSTYFCKKGKKVSDTGREGGGEDRVSR